MKRAILAVGLGILLTACASPKEPPKLGIVVEEDKGKTAQPVAPVEQSKTEWENMSDAFVEYVALAKECDERFFAKVEPEKIDRWELPIDVPKMEEKCDDLIFNFDEMIKKPAYFRNPTLDAMMRTTARVADQYMILALRCKKVGVKDKLPYIKLVTRLRDELRAEVTALATAWDKALTEKELDANSAMSAEETIRTANVLLVGMHKAFMDYVVTQRESQWPTWRYSLWVEKAIVEQLINVLKSPRVGAPEKYLSSATALATTLGGAVDYFTGEYFDTEEEQGPVVYKAVAKAFKDYEKLTKALKL